MRDQPEGGRDALHRPEEPEEQVDGVDALVHQRPAPVEREGAAPGGGVVIGLGAPPRDERRSQCHRTEAARVQRGLQRERPAHVAAGQDACDGHPGGVRGGDQFIAFRQGDLQRLLDDHVLARADAGEGGGEVVAAGGAQADDVDRGVGQERLRRRRDGAPMGGGERAGLRGGAVIGRDEARAGNLSQGFRMELGDHAGSPDAEPERSLGHGGS